VEGYVRVTTMTVEARKPKVGGGRHSSGYGHNVTTRCISASAMIATVHLHINMHTNTQAHM
jgi:hypothetical protein